MTVIDCSPSHKTDLGNLQVLVVGDSEMTRSIEAILANEGIATSSVAGGKNTIKVIQRFHYDAILMDIVMEGLNGYEATHFIRTAHPNLPIIALCPTDDQSNILANGITDLLYNPIKKEVLLQALVEHCLNPDLTLTTASTPTPSDSEKHNLLAKSLPFINTVRLLTLYAGDEVQIRRCIKVFCQSFNNWESLYYEACKRKDSASARNLAHRLKGAAANIGDLSLAELARQLETNHRENRWSGHDSLLNLFSEHLTQLNEELHDYEERTRKTASACVHRDSALQMLSDLKQSLLKHQLIDDALIEDIRTLLHLNSVKEQAEQLLLSLNVFDYPSAQQQCDNIIRELKNDF